MRIILALVLVMGLCLEARAEVNGEWYDEKNDKWIKVEDADTPLALADKHFIIYEYERTEQMKQQFEKHLRQTRQNLRRDIRYERWKKSGVEGPFWSLPNGWYSFSANGMVCRPHSMEVIDIDKVSHQEFLRIIQEWKEVYRKNKRNKEIQFPDFIKNL